MNASAAPRGQRWPLYAGGVILLLILLLALLRHHMQPEHLSATLLAQAEGATGLSLKLAVPADVSLWPDLNIVLRGLEARSEAGARPLLTAERVELALPWGTLWGREIELTALRLQRPQLDRDALANWLSARPSTVGPAAPPRLPRLAAELAISEGRVFGRAADSWALEEIDLQLSRLLPGKDFRLSLALDYREGDLRIPLQADAAGQLATQGMPLELAPLALRWLDPEREDEELLRLNGHLELAWPHRLQLLLEGRGRRWPRDWPSLPRAADESPGEYTLALEFVGTPEGRGPLTARFARGSLQADLQADAAELLEWIAQPGPRDLPPAQFRATVPLIEQPDLRIEGLQIELRETETEADAD
ncbi:AsmA family protein [Aquimonas voraii]|uniref:AsmA family protein n=1 Tax=Aquimonas voraii TaxID=265719 RepID=A0A1G7A5Z9_9GAMM|nr:AsmA family protein [Aquimonas voraii]SDE10093.1 AsmA family protein [Aquimonas voraii]